MATTLIALKDVSVVRKRLDTLVHAFNHITLEVRQGEWLGIIGRNGSGKSTLARVLSGLSRVSEGEVIRKSDSVLRMVLQNPDAQIVGQTVFEDLAFGMENVCIPGEEMQSRATLALHQVGLDVPFDTPIEHLSGGQKQLLCVAGALVTEPDCIIFDESTAMLDPLSRHRLLDTVSTLHQSGLTVVWITQWSEELTFATNVLALDEGQVSFYGSPRSFFYEVCGSLGYPPPYPVQVAIALSGQGVELTDRPITPNELSTALQAVRTASEGASVL